MIPAFLGAHGQTPRGSAGTVGLDVPGVGYGAIPCTLASTVHVPRVGLGAGSRCQIGFMKSCMFCPKTAQPWRWGRVPITWSPKAPVLYKG